MPGGNPDGLGFFSELDLVFSSILPCKSLIFLRFNQCIEVLNLWKVGALIGVGFLAGFCSGKSKFELNSEIENLSVFPEILRILPDFWRVLRL